MIAAAQPDDGMLVPFDQDYFAEKVGEAVGGADPVDWYMDHGLERKVNPTRFFVTDWYAWQNPDWVSHRSPYLHYLETGRHEGRDPSPFVDMWRYLDAFGGAVSPGQAYELILQGVRSPAVGVYETRDDLRRCQRGFLNAITCTRHRVRAVGETRRALVVLQAGPGSLFDPRMVEGERNWDLLVNYYDARGYLPGLGDHVFFQKGTKFSAMWILWRRYRDLLARYDHVLFLDDDVQTTRADLNRLFDICRESGLDLAQMALTADSQCNWPDLFARPGLSAPRDLAAVEIMMPVFSARALARVARTFGASVSGFGLDLVWGKLVREAGGRVAVIDAIEARHARPVDQAGGAYYSYLRRHGLNAKAELWALACDYDTSRDMGL